MNRIKTLGILGILSKILVMNMLKEVLKHEVFPALGCTEPVAVAYAASVAGKEVNPDDIISIRITVDPGVYKNGLAVIVPNTNGERGNLIAGVLGALIQQPELKMEILQGANERLIRQAKTLIQQQKARIDCDNTQDHLYIDVRIHTSTESVRAVTEYGHTNLVLVEKNETPIFQNKPDPLAAVDLPYRAMLKEMKITELLAAAEQIDEDDYTYLKRGIEMNLLVSEVGQELKKVGHYLTDLMQKGYLVNDVFSSSKMIAASAADARMSGLNYPVMSSGGSGNQGVVAILVPYNVGQHFQIAEKTIIQSIAFSHLLNSYIKCYTGDLCPICGCAVAAGVGAAAIVYQQAGRDMAKITLAVNNLISDLGGMLCDGAKEGCALKVVSSTDSAIRAAYMALNNHGITPLQGFVGKTAEETIHNLSKISEIGMAKVDDTMIAIMMAKSG
jgi:L-cysteine desulfidase